MPPRSLLTEAARSLARRRVLPWIDRAVRPDFAACWTRANRVDGWTGRREAIALYEAVLQLPSSPVIVEIGSFLGRSSIVMGAACRKRGNGKLYCVDPFDGSGDGYSKPFYDAIRDRLTRPQLDLFCQNLHDAGVSAWIEVREGTAESVGADWSLPIDMLFLDGDHSVRGMRSAYDKFSPSLKVGGVLAVHNSASRDDYEENHDGGRRLVLDTVRGPKFAGERCVGTTTFATKCG